ncbi:MAG: arylsulfatase, partial [Acidobacteria bacterium]|nr:arylsulfatase [Acidobacteriota bacterium]
MWNRRQFWGALAASPLLAQATAAGTPNIIFILADDLGYGDLGCYGQRRITTPNIDRLAREGMRFTQAYSGSTVCAPSRCALNTGLHTGHCRTRGNRKPEVSLQPEDVTTAELLKQAGYHTGLVGKWGLGFTGTPGIPNQQGFDEFFGYHTQVQAHTYYPHQLYENQSDYTIPANWGVKSRVYAPDLFIDRALQFLDKSRDRRFFLYLPSPLPHANNELGRDTGNGMEIPDFGEYSARTWPDPEKGFAAMVARLDRDIGRVLDKVRTLGLAQNTLVLFSSDNGPHAEGGHNKEFFASSGVLRGMKRDLYEGGIRAPFLAKWPGRIAAGSTSGQVIAHWDVLPTLAEIAGVKAPAGLDGISFLPALEGRPLKRERPLYWEFHEGGFNQAIRFGDWKAIRFGKDGPIELYDLKTDPGEKTDLAGAKPDVIAQA